MAFERTFEKIFYALFPWLLIGFFAHLVVFLFAWFLMGKEDLRFQGKLGIIKYYFYTWKEAFTKVKETYEPKEETNTESTSLRNEK